MNKNFKKKGFWVLLLIVIIGFYAMKLLDSFFPMRYLSVIILVIIMTYLLFAYFDKYYRMHSKRK